MAKELQDWIIPWIDDHYDKHGTDTTKVYGDGKKVQIVEFETYKNHADPNDNTQIVALATDSVHQVRLIFDREMTDRLYKAKDYSITRHLRSLYQLKEYKILIPPYLFPPHSSTSTANHPMLDPTYRPKSRHNLFTILVTQAEWYWGSSSEPNFCSSPIDVRLALLGQNGGISTYAQGYRDKVTARLKRKERRSRSRERSVMSEQEVERMEVYEEYKRGKMGKDDEEIRRDAQAVLEIFVEEARIRSIKGQQQGMGVIIEGEAEEEEADDIEMDDLGSPTSPKGNSYEAPPFQVPQPNFSLSHPTPPTSSGEAVRSNNVDNVTPTKTSSRARGGNLGSSPTNSIPGPNRNDVRRPEDDYDEDDPIVRFLLQHAEASSGPSSSSSPPKQPDPMEVYDLLVKNQLEGRRVDWAFKPSERWMDGEEGLKRVLERVKVFGLDLVGDETEDDDDDDAEKEEAVDVEEVPAEAESEASYEDVAMLEPEQPEVVVPSLPSEPSHESQTSSAGQNSGRMMKRRRRTRSRERERGRSSETRPLDPSPRVLSQPSDLKMQMEERERSPSMVWETSPEPDRSRLEKPALTVQGRTSVSMEAKEFAEVIDGMLTSQSDEEEEIQVEVEQVREDGSASRRASTDPGEISEVEVPQAEVPQVAPHKRPNVQRVSLGSPSSGEVEERPRPSVGDKRKASVDSPFIHQPAISERERSKRQKLEEIKRLQEEVERLEADMDGNQVEMLEDGGDQRVVERVRSMSVDSTRSASLVQAKDSPARIAELETQPGRPEAATSQDIKQDLKQEQSRRSSITPSLKSPTVQESARKDSNNFPAIVAAPPRRIPSKAFLLLPAYGLRISEVQAMQIELPTLLKRE